ncbi:MAG: DUF1345 domain-containing protein [Hyphomicrobium aestuarii]|nr:DUF1345 domain-containing protein [Hyphomicrobium aestuarii]
MTKSTTPQTAGQQSRGWLTRSLAHPRVIFGIAAGFAALVLLPGWLPTAVRSSLSWNIGGVVYLALAFHLMRGATDETLKSRAARTDEGGTVILTFVLIAIVASLAATTGLAGEGRTASNTVKLLYLGLAASTLVTAWLVMQVVFAIHYAHRHYAPSKPGDRAHPRLVFPGCAEPDYWDFLYFSTSIGATSQTSDVSIHTARLRRLVTVHAIVAFFFNTMVLASAVNLAAQLL